MVRLPCGVGVSGSSYSHPFNTHPKQNQRYVSLSVCEKRTTETASKEIHFGPETPTRARNAECRNSCRTTARNDFVRCHPIHPCVTLRSRSSEISVQRYSSKEKLSESSDQHSNFHILDPSHRTHSRYQNHSGGEDGTEC